MEKINMFKTYDGVTHNNYKDGHRHLDVIYGKLMCDIGRKLCHQKYTDIMVYINDNLDKFVELKRIKYDMTLTGDNKNE